MNLIERYIKKLIIERIYNGKVSLITGPRRVGKTTLLNQILNELSPEHIWINGDDFKDIIEFQNKNLNEYKSLIGKKKLLIIDEAQKIKNIGDILKLIIDNIPGIAVLVSGSSSLSLSGTIGEPLTGRKYDYNLFPFAQCEFKLQNENWLESLSKREQRLVYGTYPEIHNTIDINEKREILRNLINSYLFKDILEIEGVKSSQLLIKILRLLAYQIGSTVSINEICTQIGLSKNTVEKYLDLLEKVFIIFRIGGFSRNPRKEISKSGKYYFTDNGIRNAIINNFNPLEIRNDIGQLWENYIICERVKWQSYSRLFSNNYFWRTYDGQEIDWVEEREGKLFAYEMKYKKQNVNIPPAWKKTYKDSSFEVIDSENYLDFIS